MRPLTLNVRLGSAMLLAVLCVAHLASLQYIFAGPPVTPASVSNADACTFWQLSTDFRASPLQENPNRDSCGNLAVWHFMLGTSLHDPQTYTRLPNFEPNTIGIPTYQTWQGSHPGSVSNLKFPFVGVDLAARLVSMHPYSSQELAILGWQSPINGKVTICGTIQDGDVGGGDGILWFIDRGATNLASGQFDNGGKQNFQDGVGSANLTDISITQNEVIYFIVHPNQIASYDTTLMDFTINSVGRTCGPHVFLPIVLR